MWLLRAWRERKDSSEDGASKARREKIKAWRAKVWEQMVDKERIRSRWKWKETIMIIGENLSIKYPISPIQAHSLSSQLFSHICNSHNVFSYSAIDRLHTILIETPTEINH